MLSVSIIQQPFLDRAEEYLRENGKVFDFTDKISMICFDGSEPVGLIAASLLENGDVSAVVELALAQDGEIFYLLYKSLFHVLERREVYPVSSPAFGNQAQMQRLGLEKLDESEMYQVNLKNYFESKCGI